MKEKKKERELKNIYIIKQKAGKKNEIKRMKEFFFVP